MIAPKRFYFAVSDLHYDDFDVIVLAPQGEIVARRKTVWRRREASTVWRARITVRKPGRPIRFQYRDLPGHVVVTRWRPLDRSKFPGPLPAKAAHMMAEVAWQSPPEAPELPDRGDELDWPNEYAAAPDISLREVEIRLLRGLRTDRSRGDRTAAARPGGYRDSLTVLVRNTIGRLEAEHVEPNYIATAGEAWTPSRRDIGDYLTAMGWFAALTAAQRSLIFQRALDPPFSFGAIGQRLSKSAETARRRYQKALDAAQHIANGRAR